jgi:phosphodiesterase/alkaline phosphatase D-like protein
MLRLLFLSAMIVSAFTACSSLPAPSENGKSSKFKSDKDKPPFGRYVVIQGPTSDKEALLNIMVPRLKSFAYDVSDEDGQAATVEKYETVQVPVVFYKVEKIFVKGLKPGKKYVLTISDEFRGKKSVVDQRSFQALDIGKTTAHFATLSCMADDWRFENVIDPMWARLKQQNPDFIVLNGDLVYVDSFEFVERKKATETDLWQRYIDSFRRIPLYHWLELKPVFATWDDHDYGTNDGDRTFVSNKPAQKLFRALFGGKPLSDGSWQPGPAGVTSAFKGFGQRFYFMDDRTFRQPDKGQKKAEAYGHWGETQHKWLIKSLGAATTPAWIFNGDQVFNGKSLDFKEVFETNHNAHFVKFIEELKAMKIPVVFSSGDIHLTEIMRIPKERLGYETYEITSSSMHSYIGSGWDNPMRLPESYVKDYNFVMVNSEVQAGGLALDLKSWGLPDKPYFDIHLKVAR